MKGDLEGMISSHVNDFNLAGNDNFIDMVTKDKECSGYIKNRS